MTQGGTRGLCVAGLLVSLAGCTIDFDRFKVDDGPGASTGGKGAQVADGGDASAGDGGAGGSGTHDGGARDGGDGDARVEDGGDNPDGASSSKDADVPEDADTPDPMVDDAGNLICESGFMVSGTECVDVEECDTDNGGCATTCVEEIGSFHCACDPGDELDADQKNCHSVAWSSGEQGVSSVGVTPHVAMNGAGDAMVVWAESGNIRALRYYIALWRGTDTIEQNAGAASEPRVAYDASQTAIAVWVQSDGSARTEIWVNRFASNAWGTATELVTSATGAASVPRVAMDGSGNAVVVWEQVNGSVTSVWGAVFTAATTSWAAAAPLVDDEAETAEQPDVAMDASGSAIAVWSQDNSSDLRTNIQSRRYSVEDAAWGAVVPVVLQTDAVAEQPSIAMDGSGNAIAAWVQSNVAASSRRDTWTNRYDASSGSWGTATMRVTDGTGTERWPVIAMNRAGDALAAWADEEGNYTIWGAHYAAGDSWNTAVQINPSGADQIRNPQVAISAAGNGLAVWSQIRPEDEDGAAILYARYEHTTGWLPSQPLLLAVGSTALSLAMDATGNGILVFTQDGAVNAKLFD